MKGKGGEKGGREGGRKERRGGPAGKERRNKSPNL